MIELTDEMRDALAGALDARMPALVATASAAGMPDMAYKGSVMVWDTDHLAFWERAHGLTLSNLAENAQFCVLYRNTETRVAWKFFGAATLLREGETRAAIMARTHPVELERDPERRGIAVLMRVDRVVQAGKTIMTRE